MAHILLYIIDIIDLGVAHGSRARIFAMPRPSGRCAAPLPCATRRWRRCALRPWCAWAMTTTRPRPSFESKIT